MTGAMPNVMIIGAPRCGTTSLYEACRNSKALYVPRDKEPKYFGSGLFGHFSGPGDEIIKRFVVKSWEEYVELYSQCRSEFACDFSTDSLYYAPESAKEIRRRLGDVKIIVLVRNPFLRCISAFNYLTRDSRETLPFFDAINAEISGKRKSWDYMWHYLGASLYLEKLSTFREEFSSVLVIPFERLVSDWPAVALEIEAHLQISRGSLSSGLRKYNQAGLPRSTLAKFVLSKNSIIAAQVRRAAKRMLPNHWIANFSRNLVTSSENSYSFPRMAFDLLASECRQMQTSFPQLRLEEHWPIPAKKSEVGDAVMLDVG